MDREFLAEWRLAYQALRDWKQVPSRLDNVVKSFLEVAQLRQESFVLSAQSVRENDQEKLMRAVEKLQQAENLPLPSEKITLEFKQVGYKYYSWGVLWLDLSTDRGAYCVYEGKHYSEIHPHQAAEMLGISPDQLTRPFLYRYPLGWFVISGLVLVGLIVWRMKVRAAKRAEHLQTHLLAQLIQDARYMKAVDMFQNHLVGKEIDQQRTDEALEIGVAHLVECGVPREEAATNLPLLVSAIFAQPLAQSE